MSIENLPAYLWSWGGNGLGQLGIGTYGNDVSSPVQAGIFTPYKLINSQVAPTFGFIDKDGNVFANGYNTQGQMGNNSTTGYLTPTKLPFSNVQDIRFGSSIMCKKDGTLYTWGSNTFGQCGHGDTINRSSPLQISGVSNVIQVVNNNDSCGYLTSDGKIFFAGRNNWGQFGNINTANSTKFVESSAAGGTKAHSVYQGSNTFYFLWQPADNYGGRSLFGSGLNNHGQLAMNPFKNNTANSSRFIQVTSLGFKKIAVCNDTVYGIGSNYSLWSWGYNLNGECGQNKVTTGYSSPVQIAGLWDDVQTSINAVIALKKDNTLWTWGYGAAGQLGTNQTNVNISSPTQIQLGNFGWNSVQKVGTSSYAWKNAPTTTPAPTDLNPTPTPTPACNLELPTTVGLIGWFDSTELSTLNTNISGEKLSNWKNKVSTPYWGQMYQTDDDKMPVFVTDNTYGGTFIDFNDDVDNGWGLLSDYKYNISSSYTIIVIETCRPAEGTSRRTVQSADRNALISLNQYTGNEGIGSYLQSKISAFLSGAGTHCGILRQSVRYPTYYVDGINRTGFFPPTVWDWGDLVMGAGGAYPKQPANTNLHEVIIYNRGLSEEEIQAINQYFICKYINNKNKLLSPTPTPTPTLPYEALELYSWGWGGEGANGDNTIKNSSLPVFIGKYNVSNIIDGTRNCAGFMTDIGTIYAWGGNSYGELGDGTIISKSSPTIMPYSNFKKISLGASIGINNLWQIQTWGYNQFGQNAQNDIVNHSSPTTVAGDFFPIDIAAGIRNSGYKCQNVLNDNQGFPSGMQNVWGAAGWNESGTLGIRNVISQSRFAQVPSNNSTQNFSKIKYGVNWALALAEGGLLLASGDNLYGQLGFNRIQNTSGFGPTADINAKYKNFSAGWYTAAGIDMSGKLFTWGKNQNGECGTSNANNNLSKPTQVGLESNWTEIKMNETGAIALKKDGTLWTWGSNAYGGIGDGTTINRSSPVQIMREKYWSKIQISQRTFMAWCLPQQTATPSPTPSSTAATPTPTPSATETATPTASATPLPTMPTPTPSPTYIPTTLWAWGQNSNGTLGNNSVSNISRPVQIGNYTYYKLIANQSDSTFGFTTPDGLVYACGSNNSGQYGNNTVVNYSVPTQLTLSDVEDIRFGSSIMCKKDGTLYTWGRNTYGQCGNNNTINSSSPIQVSVPYTVIQVSNNTDSCGFVTSNGLSFTAGRNNNGQLGNNNSINVSNFVQCSINNVSYISMGSNANYWLKKDGSLWSAGLGYLTGINSTINRSNPVQIAGSWKRVHAGTDSIIAIKTDNTLWVWGSGGNGAMGNNSTASQSAPIQIAGTYTDVSTTVDSIIALKTDGTVWSWGYNLFGQVGNNSSNNTSSPLQILSVNGWKNMQKVGASTYAWGNSLPTPTVTPNPTVTKTPAPTPSPTPTMTVPPPTLTPFPTVQSMTMLAWGGNSNSSLGITGGSRSSPTQVGTYAMYKPVYSNSGMFNGFITPDGKVYAWGDNNSGELGNGTAVDVKSPTLMPYENVYDIKFGAGIMCTSDWKLYTWGINNTGCSGTGNYINSSAPCQINIGSAKPISVFNWSGTGSPCAKTGFITENGDVYAAGSNSCGELMYDPKIYPQFNSFTRLPITNVTSASFGNSSSYFIKKDGTLWSAGLNAFGQLGINDYQNRSSPVQILANYKWKSVNSMSTSVAAIASNVAEATFLFAWGQNHFLPTYDTNSFPAPVILMSNVAQVTCMNGTIFAIKSDNTLWGIGNSSEGQFENTKTIPSSYVQVGIGTNWKTVQKNTISVFGWSGPTPQPTPNPTNTPSPMDIWSWGANNDGQVGNNTTIEQATPYKIGQFNPVIIANNGENPCFVNFDGNIWGWGATDDYQLGVIRDTYAPFTQVKDVSRPTVVPISSYLKDITSIAIGNSICCNEKGEVYTWGRNTDGSCGNGDFRPIQIPTKINITNKKAVFVCNSISSTGFITDDGYAFAAGPNSNGRYGNNKDQYNDRGTSFFTQLSITDVKFMSQSIFNFCWIKNDNTLWVSGRNRSGVLAQNNEINYSSPVQIQGQWKKVYFDNWDFAAGIKTDGSLWCWGSNYQGSCAQNTAGKTGGTRAFSNPVQVQGQWKDLWVGSSCVLAINSGNTLYSWGADYRNILGNGPNIGSASSPTIVNVYDNTTWVKINGISSDGTLDQTAFGWRNPIFTKTPTPTSTPQPTPTPMPTGVISLHSWGDNSTGQLGLNFAPADVSTPTQVGIYTFNNFCGGNQTAGFLKSNGTVMAWGSNLNGQLGTNNTTSTSYPTVMPYSDVAAISFSETSIMLKNDSTLWTWGDNTWGQLGLGVFSLDRSSPSQVNLNAYQQPKYTGSIYKVASCPNRTAWTTTTGYVFQAGDNSSGQIGNGNLNTSPNLFFQSDIVDVEKVYLSSSNTFFHMRDGRLRVCGSNQFGQMGNNLSTTEIRSIAISSGGNYYYKSFSCPDSDAISVAGIRNDDSLWAWGNNTYGQLGVNDILNRSMPVQIAGTWSAVVSNGYSMIAIKNDNTLWAWGLNTQGQVGNNSKISCSSPVQIGITSEKWIGLGRCKNSGFAWRI